MADISLRAIFNTTKDDLASSLTGLMLPKDTSVVQQKITEYLNTVCDSESEYRQNLTQSEDYILQAAMSMLNAQRDLVSVLSAKPQIKIEQIESKKDSNQKSAMDILNMSVDAKSAFIGAGGGAALTAKFFNGWAAVFGAIAGTAIALYVSNQSASTAKPKPMASKPSVKIVDQPLNVNSLLSVIEQLCDSLDNLVVTFRAQIQRVVNKYESQEKPSIEKNFSSLLEGIQSLLGYKRGHSSEETKYLPKLQERVEELADLLDSYNLEVIDYNGSNTNLFEVVESPNTTEVKSILPAIVKSGNVVLKGKIFTPKQ
jgi:molecular chaperone GrpE (heat shock protein)